MRFATSRASAAVCFAPSASPALAWVAATAPKAKTASSSFVALALPPDLKQRRTSSRAMSALGPACVKTLANFLCDGAVGLDDLSRRVLRFRGFVWLTGSGWPAFAIPCGDLAGYGRKLKSTSAYAALIAAISGLMPMMFMTRLRL